MTGPSVVSVARIEPDLALQSWDRVRRLVAEELSNVVDRPLT